jgi:hypothetical protein
MVMSYIAAEHAAFLGEQWQPIATAPRDGTWLLACEAGDELPYLCYWEEDLYRPNGGSGGSSGWFAQNWMDRWGDCPKAEHPTHWMPIPQLPERLSV